jgi:diguanylate cyclase (GGDEF)-like protein
MVAMDAKHRILVIDDDPLIRHIVASCLAQNSYEIVEAGSGAEGLAQAKAARPDLVLLDIMMPDVDGYAVCSRLRENAMTANVPVIMLTALGEIGEKIHGMQMGADDYVTKPFDPRELRSRVEAHLRRSARDLGSSPLTKLPGNPLIEQTLRARLAAKVPLAVLYIDLSYFKPYNDRYGWLKGDEVIKVLGKIILETVVACGGEGDFVGHVGGDDFVVITRPSHAEPIAQEVIRRFEAAIPRYYTAEDLERGYLEVVDRQGHPLHAPITSVAISIVSNDRRELEHPSQVADVAADLKRRVKALGGSQYVFDRRRK